MAFVYFTCAVNSISINSGNIWLHWGEEAMTPHSFTLCSLHGCLILTPPPTPPIQDYNLINRGSEFESLEHWGFCLETWILILAFFPMPQNLTFHWEFVILKKKKKKIPTTAARCIPIKLFMCPVMKGTQKIPKNLHPSLWGISWWRRSALWLYPRGPPRPGELLLHNHSIVCCLGLVHEWTTTQKNGWLAVREYMYTHTHIHILHPSFFSSR